MLNDNGLVTQGSALDQIDSVEVTVLMDNVVPFGKNFTGEHGLSLLVRAIKGNVSYQILLDTGKTSSNLLQNLQIADVDIQELDLVYISHAHYDHTGGLMKVISEKAGNTRVVAHPSIFRKTFKLDDEVTDIGIPGADREDLEQAGGNLLLTKTPLEIFPGIVSSGEVPRVTDYEGKAIGAYFLDNNGEVKQDELRDDMSLILNVKDKGLLILAGCSHAGIINIIKHSQKITGVDRIYGIIGGFHLVKSDQQVITQTVQEIANNSPELVAAGHCTGFGAQLQLASELGESFSMLGVGNRYKF